MFEKRKKKKKMKSRGEKRDTVSSGDSLSTIQINRIFPTSVHVIVATLDCFRPCIFGHRWQETVVVSRRIIKRKSLVKWMYVACMADDNATHVHNNRGSS